MRPGDIQAQRPRQPHGPDAIAPAVEPWNVGDDLLGGRFTIEGVLGRGGMGVVYGAYDHETHCPVALKTLHHVDPENLSRMKAEFRSMSDVVHPNLVGLRGLYQDGPVCFFTMERVRGRPFPYREGGLQGDDSADCRTVDARPDPTLPMESSRVPAPSAARRPHAYSPEVTADAIAQLLAGVLAIHRVGKVHRDLKPSNILRTAEGRIVILDFGLVDDRSANRSAPAQAHVSGTPCYMAPEQAAGLPPDPKNDCYAVGVILYETLTGQPPFRGTAAQVMIDKQNVDPVDPRHIHPSADPNLCAVCMALLSRSADARPDAWTALQMLGRGGLTAPKPPWALEDPALLGRQSLLSKLNDAAATVRRHRRPCFVHVHGPAGMGKSTLLDHFCATLGRDPDVRIFRGRCYEREDLPHKGIDQVLAALSVALEQSSTPELYTSDISDAEWSALTTLVPDLPARPSAVRSEAPNPAIDPRTLRHHAQQGLTTVLRRFAAGSLLVLVVDDIQWADYDGIRLLLDVFDHADPPPALLVVGHRPEVNAGQGPVALMTDRVRGMLDRVDLVPVPVPPLSAVDTRILATQLLERAGIDSSGAQLDSLCQESQGSPLIVGELALAMGEDTLPGGGPVSLERLLDQRLQPLSPVERNYFDLLCVAGRPVPTGLLTQAFAGTPDPDATIRRLLEARLCRSCRRQGEDCLEIFHDSLRERGLATLAPSALRRYHEQLANAYRVCYPREAEQLATHLEGAGHLDQAAVQAATAAAQAAGALAFDRAADLYRTALRLAPDRNSDRSMDLSLDLANVLSNCGRGSEAAPLYMVAAKTASPQQRLSLERRAAEQWLVSGHLEEGLAALDTVLRQVGLKLPKSLPETLVTLLSTRARLRIRGLRFTETLEQDVPESARLRIDACRAAWALSFVNPVQGAAFQAQYLHLALKAGEPKRIAIGLGMEATFRSTQGGSTQAQVSTLLHEQQVVSDRLQQPITDAFCHLATGQSSYMLGRWTQCANSLEQAETILMSRCKDVTWELNASRFFWGNSLILRGKIRELRVRLEAWRRDAQSRQDLYAQAGFILIGSRSLALADDQPATARKHIQKAMTLWQTPGSFGVHEFLACISEIQISLYEGRPEVAVVALDDMLSRFRRSAMTRVQLARVQAYQHAAFVHLAMASDSLHPGSHQKRAADYASKLVKEDMPWASAFALMIRATLAHQRGQRPATLDYLRQAVTALDSTDMAFYGAAARSRLGRVLASAAGDVELDRAAACFAAQGITNTPRLINMMSPGFSRPTSHPRNR